MTTRSFASDNNSGIHPDVLKAICDANVGHCVAYGDDPWTKLALERFKAQFGKDAQTFFVFNGTGANVLSLKSMARSYEAVLCAAGAHINEDECGAPEANTGSKLIGIACPDGKLTVDLIKAHLHGRGDPHHVQPKVISITQSTEFGTIYSAQEIRAISALAHAEGLLLHMDGARLSNAAASAGCTLKEMSADVGVDILSFGGTKNGLMGAEAVVVFRPELAHSFQYLRKQSMQLSSKMRFVSAQFNALLENDLWKKNATHSNSMAKLLETELGGLSGVSFTQKVQANGVFVRLAPAVIEKMREKYFFYAWGAGVIRLMCSFDTTSEDVKNFAADLKKNLN